MAMTEDLSAFFSPAEFATAATLGGVAVTGIFDNGYMQDPYGGSASQPVFTLATSAAPSNSVGSALVVGSTTYTVAEMMPDGTGITVLRLRT